MGIIEAQIEMASPADGKSDFETFYRDSWEDLYRPLALTVRDADLARDAVDEAMTRAYERWADVSEYRNPEGWVYRVALNWAISGFRRRSKNRKIAAATRDGDLIVPAEQPDVDLAVALEKLPLNQRAVVVLRFLADRSEQDVAKTLGIPVGTVKSRLHRALRRLQKELS